MLEEINFVSHHAIQDISTILVFAINAQVVAKNVREF
jgi:hypothetical protein